jgi:hypothetical protein
MKRSLETELCCLLGDWYCGELVELTFFGGGRKRPPFAFPIPCGQHRFPSCSYDAIQKQHKKKKKKKQYFADSCHHWKTN